MFSKLWILDHVLTVGHLLADSDALKALMFSILWLLKYVLLQ